jgi:hypothetical protein
MLFGLAKMMPNFLMRVVLLRVQSAFEKAALTDTSSSSKG